MSRGDLSTWRWRPDGLGVRTPTESILKARAVADLHFATQDAADELANLAI